MHPEATRLVEPATNLKRSFLGLIDDYAHHDEQDYVALYADARQDYERYVDRLRAQSQGRELLPGWVPCSTYWLTVGDSVAGVVRIRHRLTPWLAKFGGHIGYDIRPSRRGQGLGSEILRLTLERCRALGIERVLLVCDHDNTPSIRVIMRNGGTLEERLHDPDKGKLIERYWIDTQASPNPADRG